MLSESEEREGGPNVLRRILLVSALLTLVVILVATAAVGVARYPAFLHQPGARTLVVELFSVVLAYVLAIGFILRAHSRYWRTILRWAVLFGAVTGIVEILNIGIENSTLLIIRGPIPAVGF